MTTITKAEWEAKGRELFGEDQDKWGFVCPSCGIEQSLERVRAEHEADLPKLREGKYRIESECIGRHIPKAGCDWCAYGLFRGPLFVAVGEGADETLIPCFDFAGKPFTRSSVCDDRIDSYGNVIDDPKCEACPLVATQVVHGAHLCDRCARDSKRLDKEREQ